MRVDNASELIRFLEKLKSYNIEIPENIILEIDSKWFKTDIEKTLEGFSDEFKNKSFESGEFMGQKIKFKDE